MGFVFDAASKGIAETKFRQAGILLLTSQVRLGLRLQGRCFRFVVFQGIGAQPIRGTAGQRPMGIRRVYARLVLGIDYLL